jgi:D-glycero-D-manno-heptose 1,7-bisphosphate phosphatase
MKPCVFFDRDGIVNRRPVPGYILKWEDFILLPEFVDVLRICRRLGFEAVIATNQRCVARGLITLQALNAIHARFRRELQEQHGLDLLDVLVCPHERNTCECRKPKPGLMLMAAERHGLDLGASWMIGDQSPDTEAGRRAGCRTILVGTPDVPGEADVHVDSLASLKTSIEKILTGN